MLEFREEDWVCVTELSMDDIAGEDEGKGDEDDED
jgi:hypothetical protein